MDKIGQKGFLRDSQHCGVASYEKQKNPLSIEEIKDIIHHVAELGSGTIYFSGGEPLLRSGLVDLVHTAVERGCKVQFDTNGLLLDATMARQLSLCGGQILVGVSLDSPEKKAHDLNRGVEGIFDAAVEAIESCVRERVPVNISYYMTRDAFQRGELERIIQLSRELQVDGLRVLTPALSGRLFEDHDSAFSREEESTLMVRLEEEKGFAFLEHKNIYNNHRCSAFDMELMYISPYGEVQPCIYVPVRFGNLREEPLTRILNRMWKHWIFKGKNIRCLAQNLPCLEMCKNSQPEALPLDSDALS